jgi:Protein of unknown function (DUF4058)
MPLRDHFRPLPTKKRSWSLLHGGWPMVIVQELTKKLPPRYTAGPNVYLASGPEIDIGTFDQPEHSAPWEGTFNASTATLTWSPPRPSVDVVMERPAHDEFEVQVYDEELGRLVGAIEIVSPANKDRPVTRRAFIAKCAALLWQNVSVAIVDIVTTRHANLYLELLDYIGQEDPLIASSQVDTYAAECRWLGEKGAGRLQTWSHVLEIGQPLPTLPLWLTDSLAIPLELERNYEQTCQDLRIK